ncbi:prolactin-releasing peptide receptor [Lasius niger]|uniref:Prolactin-releasing peptide receptor n=1 Tax=Lasius niger TaxID=67767 RepID=A0A0J7NSP3_LASNI|nr:prolactin-releasing peptide receptor [Lasius niger]
MINDTEVTHITSTSSVIFTMQNTSTRSYNHSEDVMSNVMVQTVFCAFYIIIFVLGIFGNVLVVFVVGRNRQMHTVTNLFIANLALSDVLLCVLAVPFTPLYTFLSRWVFGKTLCHLVPYAQGVSVYISTLTLTSIAVDRFLVIIYPFHPRMKIEICLAIIVSIWVIALVVTLPYGLYMQLEEPYTYCEEHWPSEPFRKVFSSLTSIVQFVVPFFVIAFCYICVSIKLNDRARAKPGSKTSKREEADRERKRRTNRMLIAMVAIFGVSWLPLNIVNVVDDFYSQANDWSYYKLCFFTAHFVAMSSTCYNPFLYAWLNDNFRKEFKQVLPCFSRNSNGGTPRDREGCKGDKLCNGNNTMQETLLPSNTTRAQNPEGCEMIILEPTTNISKEPDQPSSSSKDFDDVAL